MLQNGMMAAHNNKKSDIRFIRNVAAPKKSPSFKSHSSSSIHYQASSGTLPVPSSLLLSLTLPDRTQRSVLFSFGEHARVTELTHFIKQKIGMDNVYFKSGSILVDYFLTLSDRPLTELTTCKLELSVHPIEICQEISLKSVEVLKCIGSGGFSKVVLARVFGLLMAVKVIDKEFVFKTAKQSIVENEKLILQQCEGHPFITRLYFSFETNKYIILGMEYCNGGELFNLLRRVKKMREDEAKFYFLETLLAIEHLHSKGILYRDLKPENIIIDTDGHVRLADFGLSKIVNRSVTYSFCGSAEYMSPEMLLKKGHSYEVDYYCLGALLYELVTGLPPFYSHNQSELFNNILNSQLTFPPHAVLSEKLKQFLEKILQKEPEKRFQSIGEIMADPWVSHTFNRELLLSKKVKPPYTTNVFSYNFDDSEFGCQEEVVLRLIDSEKESPQVGERVFPNFYYESQEMVRVREEVQKNGMERNFMKNKSVSKQDVHVPYLPRNNSIQTRNPYLAQSSKKIEQNQGSFRNQPTSTFLPSSLSSSKLHVRSTQNVRGTVSPYSLQGQGKTSPVNIYTSKARFPPASLAKKQKLSHQAYYQKKSLDMKLNSSTGDMSYEWSGSKEKSSSLDRRQVEKKSQLNYHNKNYLAEFNNAKYANPKVKKSFRQADTVNFHYGTLHR